MKDNINNSIHLNLLATTTFLLSFLSLNLFSFNLYLSPIIIYSLMILLGSIAIISLSNEDKLIKIKLFISIFSLLLIYILLHDSILLTFYPNKLPFDYPDDKTFYHFSDLSLPYLTGEKHFLTLFSFASYPMHDLPLHVMFSGTINLLSHIIDGENNILVQKLLSPFFASLFSVILYSTLKFQFKNAHFALRATLVYSLLSAMFIYSTSLMRDTDIALAYMLVIYLFFQPNSKLNFFFIFTIASITLYLRTESGLVLFGILLLYSYFYIQTIRSKNLRFILYLFFITLFIFIVLLISGKLMAMINMRSEINTTKALTHASSSSIGLLLNKLPFPLNTITKLLFGQIQPFPFFNAIDRFPEALSGIFWPLIFISMLYTIIQKNLQRHLNQKTITLLLLALLVLLLMSSEPMARRMMSVYPIIYIVSLYFFLYSPRDKIKYTILYYLFGIMTLNTLYYIIKL